MNNFEKVRPRFFPAFQVHSYLNAGRRWLGWAPFLLVVSWVMPMWAQEAAETTLEPERLQAALLDLSAQDFKARQAAVNVLEQYPDQTLPELRKLTTSFDPDVALLARRLYSQIQSRQIEEKLQRFVEESERSAPDEGADDGHDWDQELPLWKLFEERLGDQSTTRLLYARAVREHREEFLEIGQNPINLRENWERILQRHSDRRTMTRSTIATLLILSLQDEFWGKEGPDERLISALENQLASNPIAFRSAPFENANRILLVQWCRKRRIVGQHFASYHSYLQMVLNCHVPEAFPNLMELSGSPRIAAYARGTSILYAIALAPNDKVVELESLVNDATVVATPRYSSERRQIECRISDYALMGLAFRTGMDFERLGLEITEPGNVLRIDRNQIGFGSPAERKAAIERWLAYRSEKLSDWPKSVIRIP